MIIFANARKIKAINTFERAAYGNFSKESSFSSLPSSFKYTRVAASVGMDIPSPKNNITFFAFAVNL